MVKFSKIKDVEEKNMIRKYEKPFGTFELEIIKGEKQVQIKGRINNEDRSFFCKRFDKAKKVVVFWDSHKITVNGKNTKADGILLPDFDDVYAEYERMQKELDEEIANRKSAEIEAIKSGQKKIKVEWHDGEYL